MNEVVFYEIFDEEAAALKACLPARVKPFFFKNTIQEAKKRKFAPLISIRTQSQVPEAWAHKLQGILTRSTGYDHILDFRKKTHSRAACGFLAEYCSRAVAEHAFTLVCALLKKLPRQINQFKRFDRDHLTGTEFANKNFLVVGVGRIGSEVVNLARGCGMKVRGVDIDPRLSNLEYVPLTEGLAWSHIVVSALPLTDPTRDLFNYQTCKKARKGQIFVNVGRGEVAPLSGLKRLLDEKVLAGIGLDVFEKEGDLAVTLRRGRPTRASRIKTLKNLLARDNVIFTPHNAFNTSEALERKARQTVHSIRVFLERGVFPCPVPEDI